MFDQILFILFDEPGLIQFSLGLLKYKCLQNREEQGFTDKMERSRGSPGLALPQRSVGGGCCTITGFQYKATMKRWTGGRCICVFTAEGSYGCNIK